MARIVLYKSSSSGIKDARKRKYNPSTRYKAIIEKTNKRIDENRRKSDRAYEKASKCLAR